jgi:hypothetical protein
MSHLDDLNAVEQVLLLNLNRASQHTDSPPTHQNRVYDSDLESLGETEMVVINNRWIVPAPPDELGLEVDRDHSLRRELGSWETFEPGYRDAESIEVTEEDLERDTFPAYPKTWQLRVQRAVALEMVLSARRELVQLGLPGEETDRLLEDLDVREQAMRRPQHCDVVEAASEIKSIDGDSTWAEHETARDRWRAEIVVLKAAAAAREMDKETAEKTNAPAVQAAIAWVERVLFLSVVTVTVAMVAVSIFLAWYTTPKRPTAASPEPSPTLD